MYRRILVLLLPTLLASISLFAQEFERDSLSKLIKLNFKQFGIGFHGYVKSDLFFDTHQNVEYREGHFLYFPKRVRNDINGNDVNEVFSTSMLPIQTRFASEATGNDVWGAKTYAMIEGEFFGHNETDVNGYRLRHAFIKLTWPKSELLTGQFWHPLFVENVFPSTLSFNTGTPYQPFSRAPQIRYSYKALNWLTIAANAITERDFASAGPNGITSKYARNAGIPELNLRLTGSYFFVEGKPKLLLGLSGSYWSIRPFLERNSANGLMQVTDKVHSYFAQSYFRFDHKKLTIKGQANVGTNPIHLLMTGGFAQVFADTTNLNFSPFIYKPATTASTWLDISTNQGDFQYGIFVGYAKNLGADQDIHASSKIFGRSINDKDGTDIIGIDHTYRIAPRCHYQINSLRLALEIEHTVAGWGTPKANDLLTFENVTEAHNTRIFTSVFYFF